MKKKLRIALLVIFALVFVVSAVRLGTIWYDYAHAEKLYNDIRDNVLSVSASTPAPTPTPAATDAPASSAPTHAAAPTPKPTPEPKVYSVDFAALREAAPEAVAWLLIPDTVISYPIMQHDDNDYYLKHAYNGESSSSGSIFLDYRVSPDLTDCHSILYGHNMKNGSMFGDLGEFRDDAYIAAHPSIYILMENGTLRYDIYSAYVTSASYDSYNVSYGPGEEFDEYGARLERYSWFTTPAAFQPGDRVLTLSTCVGDSARRFVIHAVLREQSDETEVRIG